MVGEISRITHKQALDFLLPRHYSGRAPQVTVAYGWWINTKLVAVCTFGKPASNSLCKGILGKEWSSQVYELNRLCRVEELKENLSQFVSACLRDLKKRNWVVVSYADRGMSHCGYIYQACNFLYTGATKRRTDKYTEGNKHSRHYDNDKQGELRKVRTSKHRYVFLCTGNKKLKREWQKNLKYPILPYPKEANKNYVLGEYLTPILVKKRTA